jgi:hypothetical protein
MSGIQTSTGRRLRDPGAVSFEARRLVGFERHYSCGACAAEQRSWSRLGSCPRCGEAFLSAVIRRAALAG